MLGTWREAAHTPTLAPSHSPHGQPQALKHLDWQRVDGIHSLQSLEKTLQCENTLCTPHILHFNHSTLHHN
jgi:hypothetical protein